MKNKLGSAAAVLLAVLLAVSAVSGCRAYQASSGGSSYSNYAADTAMAMPETTVAETMAAAAGAEYDHASVMEDYDDMSGDFDGAFDTGSAEIPAPMDEAGSEAGSAAAGSADGDRQYSETDRKLIRTVNLSVETTEYDALLGKISQVVENEGGYIEQSEVSGNSISSSGAGRRYAYMTIRIPSARLDDFLSQVSEQSNVTNRSESVEDVTLQYTDVESRKKSLTIEQERLWELLEKADTVDSIIALESRLSEIRYQLEKYESRLRTYDNQVDYSTVHLDISEVRVFTPTEPDSVLTRIRKGFKRNLEGVAAGAVDLFVWFVSSLPSIVVFVIFLAVLWLIVRAAGRNIAQKKRTLKGRTQNERIRPHLFGRKRSAEKTESGSAEGDEPEGKTEADGKAETEDKPEP